MSLSLKKKLLTRTPKLKIIPENTEVEQESVPYSPSVPSAPEFPLQKGRLEKRLSLSEVAERLCLPESTVKALEEERWDFFFQETSYVLGFIHSYGRVLRISTNEVAQRFKEFKAPSLHSDKENWLTESQPGGPQTPSQSILWGSLCSSLMLIFLLTPYFCLQKQIDLTVASDQKPIPRKQKMLFFPKEPQRTFVKKASFVRSHTSSASSKNFLEVLQERLS